MSSLTSEIQAATSKRYEGTNEWIPWKVKQGRPQSIPGCQNTDSLSELAEDVDQCPVGEYCYYYRCRKCLPLLALDCLVPEYKIEMVFIPHIDTIKPKKSWMFEVDCGYHGEVVEFYDNYLSRMTKLKGIAINGWSNSVAKVIFDAVDDTFKGTKWEISKGFEVDWLLLSGSALTVFEVGMRGETEENPKNLKSKDEAAAPDKEKESEDTKRVERLISKKIDQMVQNCIIFQHLLEATGCQDISVNYVMFFPNITTELIRNRVEKLHKKALSKGRQFSLDANSSSNGNERQVAIGFAGSDCISQKTIHIYSGDGKLGDGIQLEELLNVGDKQWTEQIRYLAATVVTSLSMSKHSSPSQEKDVSKESSKPQPDKGLCAAVGWNPKNQRKSNFPTDLLLGPEQQQVINQKLNSKNTIIVGEPGCGKTTTLLAILFKYSGKHVTKKLRKVVFFIPEEKEDFRKYVKNFIIENCQPEWVEVSPLRSLEKLIVNYENIYLIDEYYGSGPELTKCLNYTCGNFFIAVISAQSSHGAITTGFDEQTSIFFFRRSYRTPEPISRVCSKLRRLIDLKDGKDSHMNIPWAMSFFNGPPINTRKPFKFLSYSDCITSMLSGISCELKSRTLCTSLDIKCLPSQVVDEVFRHYTVYHLESEKIMLPKIPFTGSEFENVIILLGESVDPCSHSCLLFLHNAVSRATETVYILCKDAALDKFKSLLSVSDETDILFEKLRPGVNLGSQVLDSVRDSKNKLEVWKRILVCENRDQYKALENSCTNNLSPEEKLLIPRLQMMQKLSLKKLPQVIELFNYFNSFTSSEPQLDAVIKFFEFIPEIRFDTSMCSHDNSSKKPLTLDENTISFLENLMGDSDRIAVLLQELADVTRGRGFEKEADFFGYLVEPDQAGNVLKAIQPLLSKTARWFIFDAKLLYRLAVYASPNIGEKLLQKSSSGSCLLHHLTVRMFLCDPLLHIPGTVKFSDEALIDNYNQNCLMLSVTDFATFQVVLNRAKGQGDLPKLLKLRDVYGWTCLRWACRVDNLKVIKALIFHGADWANDIDNEGRTLIHLVSTFGFAQILQYFLTLDMKQPEPLKVSRKKDTFGMTSLHVACFFGRVETARLLVEKAPDLAHKLFRGINCLTIASWCIFEDGEALREIFKEELPLQTIDEWQKDLLKFCIKKVHRLNFKSFTNSEKKNELLLKKYLRFIPSMVVMALFNMP